MSRSEGNGLSFCVSILRERGTFLGSPPAHSPYIWLMCPPRKQHLPKEHWLSVLAVLFSESKCRLYHQRKGKIQDSYGYPKGNCLKSQLTRNLFKDSRVEERCGIEMRLCVDAAKICPAGSSKPPPPHAMAPPLVLSPERPSLLSNHPCIL